MRRPSHTFWSKASNEASFVTPGVYGRLGKRQNGFGARPITHLSPATSCAFCASLRLIPELVAAKRRKRRKGCGPKVRTSCAFCASLRLIPELVAARRRKRRKGCDRKV